MPAPPHNGRIFVRSRRGTMVKLLLTGVLAAAGFWGCSAPVPAPATGPADYASPAPSTGPAAPLAHYRCEQNIEFTVRFADDSAMVDAGPRGSELLLRDAGGTTPLQTVYSNPRMRAEFGLGVSGREAILRYPLVPLVANCVQK
jgi:hypothetical protein